MVTGFGVTFMLPPTLDNTNVGRQFDDTPQFVEADPVPEFQFATSNSCVWLFTKVICVVRFVFLVMVQGPPEEPNPIIMVK